jgi:hypothetical protein
LISPGAPSATSQHRRPQPARDQVASEREPVLVRFAHPEHHRKQHPLALFGESPGDQDALLGPIATDREKHRIEKQRRQLNAVEVAALERLKPIAQL